MRVAVIAAHPDDEVLGFGGAIARHADAGDHVDILILATGLASRGAPKPEETRALRESGQKAVAILGAASLEFHDFPDNAMDTIPLLDVAKRVEAFLATSKAQRVYTHHAGDLNIDHRIAHSAVLTACRPQPDQLVREVLAGEVNSATEWAGPGGVPFVPTEFIDISATLDRKLSALGCYAGEMRPWPHSRSIEAVQTLARWRGSQVGLPAAEAFMTIRRIA